MYFLIRATGSGATSPARVNVIVISSRQWSENYTYSITLGRSINLTPEAKPCSVTVHFGNVCPVTLVTLV